MGDPSGEADLVAQIQAARGRDWPTAAKRTAELRARFPHRPLGYEVGVAAARVLNRLDEADAVLAAAVARFGDAPWLTLQQALTAQVRRDAGAAERYAATLRRQSPEHPAGYQIGADGARDAGRLDEAQAIVAAARARFPEEGWPLLLEAKTCAARGDVEAALQWAAQARAARPQDAGGYALAATWLRDRERLDEAQALLDAAAAQFPAAPWLAQKRAALAQAVANRRAAARLAEALAAPRPPTRPADRVAVIVGMHRAGTSLCAKLVERLGFPLGGPLLRPSPDNPDGYREHREIYELHTALLGRLGAAWDASWSVRAEFDVGRLDDEGRALAARLEQVAAAQLRAHGGRWAVKDPRVAVLLPLWRDLLARLGVEPVWILAVRDPRAVAASLYARNRLPLELGELLWSEHYLQALRHLGPRLDAVVHYERWFAEPDAQLESLARSLAAPAAAAAAARGAIHARLRHAAADAAPTRLALSGELHAALTAAAPDLAALQRRAETLWRALRDLAQAQAPG